MLSFVGIGQLQDCVCLVVNVMIIWYQLKFRFCLVLYVVCLIMLYVSVVQ